MINSAASMKAPRTEEELTVMSEGRTGDWVLVFRILTPILTTLPESRFNLSFSPPITLPHTKGLEPPCLIEVQFNLHTLIFVVSFKR